MAIMMYKMKFLIIFMLALSFELFAESGQVHKTQIVVAMPFRPGLPLDPHWYTEEYVEYIANLLPLERYEVSGYFVSFENISQFLGDMEKLKAQKRDVCVLNFCDGGEWDGYVGISLCRLWEKHPINAKVRKSGADYQFILNSDDKIKMQTFLSQANLNSFRKC